MHASRIKLRSPRLRGSTPREHEEHSNLSHTKGYSSTDKGSNESPTHLQRAHGVLEESPHRADCLQGPTFLPRVSFALSFGTINHVECLPRALRTLSGARNAMGLQRNQHTCLGITGNGAGTCEWKANIIDTCAETLALIRCNMLFARQSRSSAELVASGPESIMHVCNRHALTYTYDKRIK